MWKFALIWFGFIGISSYHLDHELEQVCFAIGRLLAPELGREKDKNKMHKQITCQVSKKRPLISFLFFFKTTAKTKFLFHTFPRVASLNPYAFPLRVPINNQCNQSNAMQSNPMQCNPMQSNAIQSIQSIQSNAIQFNIVFFCLE